jgi:hypothetical protein
MSDKLADFRKAIAPYQENKKCGPCMEQDLKAWA